MGLKNPLCLRLDMGLHDQLQELIARISNSLSKMPVTLQRVSVRVSETTSYEDGRHRIGET